MWSSKLRGVVWLAVWSLLGVLVTGYEERSIGDHVNGSVSLSNPVRFFYILSNKPEEQAIRVLVESDEANIRHPILITIRQPRGVVSLSVPHIESGYSYSTVERTLCPLLNAVDENEQAQILVDITTSSNSPLGFSLVAQPVVDYRLELNKTVSLIASPSAPAYYVFEYPEEQSQVRIRFSSLDNTSRVCAIASVQSTYCPNVELLDNPDHRGTYQTMKSKAAIFQRRFDSAPQPSQFDFIYVVVTVLPSNEEFSSCQLSGRTITDSLITLETADNFNPVPYNGSERVKHFKITIEPALSDSGYVVAIVVSTIVYMSFYIIALVWIIIFDWCKYDNKYLTKQVNKLRDAFLSSHTNDDDVEAVTQQDSEPVRPVEPVELVEPDDTERCEDMGSPTPLTSDPSETDQIDGGSGIRSINRHHSNSRHGNLPGRLNKRPSLLSILTGSHWNTVISEMSPPPANRVAPFRRYQSHSESHSPRAYRHSPNLALRHSRSVESTNRHRLGVDEVDHPQVAGGTTGNDDDVMASSEERDIEAGISETSTETLQININVVLSKLPELDESAFIQKKYNRLSWYLLTVIIFYGIPAFQLVLTYQQLSNISGNEDICYYNTLCSHPWRVSDSMTINAFNNVFSNIGFFILGFLLILIAYRRRTIYRAFERLNEDREKHERVGVPQHFGIYYAIGLALMAEGFMSLAYHICPSGSNYQFDTTFMFVLAGLGLFKLMESRSPDLDTPLHIILFFLALMILLLVVGALYSSSVVFYGLFFIIHVLSTLVVTVEVYYRWQLKPTKESLLSFYHHFKDNLFSLPLHLPKFVIAVISNLLNFGFALCAVIVQPVDFGTFFLAVLLTNFIVQLIYYTIVKCVYREWPSLRPLVFVCLAVAFWIMGIYFYSRAVTNWLESPAVSRDGNEECLILGFFDTHDMWHFVAAFALFFSSLMLMTLDDKQEGTPRTNLHVF